MLASAFSPTPASTMETFIKHYALAAILVVSSIGWAPVTADGGSVYQEALGKSLLFFEAQRSGYLPPDQRVKWRGNSGLQDGFQQGVDLVGGYYDSGDHVKFGFPMAFSMTMLSWSAIQYQKEIAAANQLEYVLGAIRWGTDYFIKAHRQPNIFWCQVGDGNSDHACWQRPEEMTTPRTAYKVDAQNPGSDVAGETAAAMAAASIAFKPFNSTYSDVLLLHAKQLFTFADTFRGRYDDSVTAAHDFFPSTGYSDELLWAAAWLFQATNDQYYLNYVVDNSASFGGTGWGVRDFSWDNKYAGTQVLLSKVLFGDPAQPSSSTLKQYQAKAEYFLCACLQKNNGYNVPMTPGGLLYIYEWNNLQHVTAASFLLAVYSDYLTVSNATLNCPDGQIPAPELLNFAQSQADYILGKNPKFMSYLVGYGTKFPVQVHHRGASIEAESLLPAPVGCVEGFARWFLNWQGNPNVITGALVGGPDQNDDFFDLRSDYEQTEPSLAGNAPLVGLFAKLDSVSGFSGLPQPAFGVRHYTTTKAPVKFIHSITNSWIANGTEFYRHRVIVKNTGKDQITELKLNIENLTGTLWGLSTTEEKNVYDLPPWLKVFNPGSEFIFVYVQEGPQAHVSVLSYH